MLQEVVGGTACEGRALDIRPGLQFLIPSFFEHVRVVVYSYSLPRMLPQAATKMDHRPRGKYVMNYNE